MLILDAFFRFSGVGLLLFSAILAIRDLPRSTSFYLLLLANLTLLCHYLGFTPAEFKLPYQIRVVLRIADVFLLFFVWLFALSLFKNNFKLSAFHWICGLIICGFMMAERFVNFSWLGDLPTWWAVAVNSMAFMIVLHLFFVTITGRNDDLLEKRRASRLHLIFIITIFSILTILLGSILLPEHQPTVNVISLWPVIIGISFWLIKIEPQAFSFDPLELVKNQHVSTRDLQLSEQLDLMMTKEQIYLENNLSVDDLANRLGVGAPRLRQFINQNLKYRNFSNYINSFRITDIKNALERTENDHLPILTLALNHGFNSLPPFNRAFKKQIGIPPSEYRKQLQNRQK